MADWEDYRSVLILIVYSSLLLLLLAVNDAARIKFD